MDVFTRVLRFGSAGRDHSVRLRPGVESALYNGVGPEEELGTCVISIQNRCVVHATNKATILRHYYYATTDTLTYMYRKGGRRKAWMEGCTRAGGGGGTITAWQGGEEEELGYSGWRERDYIPTKRGEDGGGARTKTRRTVRPRSETRRVQKGGRGHGEARSAAAQREVSYAAFPNDGIGGR